MSTEKGLLGLTMIVKDEARTIERTLASVKPHIDAWLILDTGSTDDTREVAARAMEGVPGEVREAPFIDFSTTRNHAIDLLGDRTEFFLWLDADDVLRGGDAIRRFLARERRLSGPDREAYYVRVDVGIRFDSARIARTSAGWRFRGAVHEVLMGPDRPPPSHRVPDAMIDHFADQVSGERSRARWERDVGLLSGAIARDPNDARSAFYLAQTFLWLGRLAEAEAAFRRRVDLGGWSEEVYQSKVGLADVAARRGDAFSEVLTRYLDAHAFAPHRAEPLHAIALHYNARGEHALSLLFARRGYEMPLPVKDTLFVDEEVYRWKLADLVGTSAYWVGEYALGEEAARKAVRAMPNDPRLKKNLEFYLARKKK